jgi:hypothetical protein
VKSYVFKDYFLFNQFLNRTINCLFLKQIKSNKGFVAYHKLSLREKKLRKKKKAIKLILRRKINNINRLRYIRNAFSSLQYQKKLKTSA